MTRTTLICWWLWCKKHPIPSIYTILLQLKLFVRWIFFLFWGCLSYKCLNHLWDITYHVFSSTIWFLSDQLWDINVFFKFSFLFPWSHQLGLKYFFLSRWQQYICSVFLFFVSLDECKQILSRNSDIQHLHLSFWCLI